MAQASFTPVKRPPANAPPAPPKAASDAPAWTVDRLFVVLSAGLVVVALLFEFGFAPEVAMMGMPGLPGVIFAVVLAFYARPWVYLAAGILNAVLPLMVLFLFGAFEGLADPTTGRSFAALMCLVGALALGLGGGIHGFAASRKGRGRAVRELFVSRSGVAAALFAAVLVGASLAGIASGARVKEMVSAGGGYDFAVDTSVPVVMADFAFAPSDVAVPAGQIVEIKIENQDNTFHTFTYELDGKTYNHDVPGGSTTGFLVKFDEAGTIPYWCAPHSSNAPEAEDDEEMRGTIVVG